MKRSTPPFKFDVRFCLGLTVILFVLWITVDAVSRRKNPLELFPPSVPLTLSFIQEELPDGYDLVKDEAILEALNLDHNPGYLTLPVEQAALAQRGGLCSVAAMYSQEGKVRLMLNAVYFRNAKICEEFIQVESQKNLHMAAFRKTLPSSVWLVFIASDVDQNYSEIERAQFKVMLDHYQRRLELEPLFDHLTQPQQKK